MTCGGTRALQAAPRLGFSQQQSPVEECPRHYRGHPPTLPISPALPLRFHGTLWVRCQPIHECQLQAGTRLCINVGTEAPTSSNTRGSCVSAPVTRLIGDSMERTNASLGRRRPHHSISDPL